MYFTDARAETYDYILKSELVVDSHRATNKLFSFAYSQSPEVRPT